MTLCTTDDTARTIEEAQDVIGQGPGPDAFASGVYARLELLPSDEGPDPRWTLLESRALTDLAPVVVHAVPIGEGDRVIGVLTMYKRAAGHELDLDAAVTVAQVLAVGLLTDGPTQQEAGHGPWSERAEVHQATGMVVAQLGIREEDALALIRAHAYSHDQSVARSAHAVVSHELAFSATPEQEIEST